MVSPCRRVRATDATVDQDIDPHQADGHAPTITHFDASGALLLMAIQERRRVVVLIGIHQILIWAATYYLPAMLAPAMARDLGLAPATVYAAFSMSLMVSAPLGPWSGRYIDRHGGRPMLIFGNLACATGLVALCFVQGPWGLFAAWAVMGVGMGCGLYDAAFASVTALFGRQARNAITGVTLFGGFASTVGWPLTSWMELAWGWRGACLGWAAVMVLVGVPLCAALPRRSSGAELAEAPEPGRAGPAPDDGTGTALAHPIRTGALLAYVFAANWFIAVAMAAHLPRLLQEAGAGLVAAVSIGALIGPAQVAGRLLEIGWLRRWHSLLSARLASLGHPAGVAALLLAGPAAAPVFAVLHGLGNGIMTIARGTLPLELFGAKGYGARQGWLILPSRVSSALAPYFLGLVIDAWGAATLWLTCALGLSALLALLAIPRPAALPPHH